MRFILIFIISFNTYAICFESYEGQSQTQKDQITKARLEFLAQDNRRKNRSNNQEYRKWRDNSDFVQAIECALDRAERKYNLQDIQEYDRNKYFQAAFKLRKQIKGQNRNFSSIGKARYDEVIEAELKDFLVQEDLFLVGEEIKTISQLEKKEDGLIIRNFELEQVSYPDPQNQSNCFKIHKIAGLPDEYLCDGFHIANFLNRKYRQLRKNLNEDQKPSGVHFYIDGKSRCFVETMIDLDNSLIIMDYREVIIPEGY